MNVNFAIAEDLEQSAEWRRNKAVEFPDDADRNNKAADELEALAVLFRNDDSDEDILAEYAEMFDDDNPTVDPSTAHEAKGIVTNQVGFGGNYPTAEDFMLAVIAAAKPTK